MARQGVGLTGVLTVDGIFTETEWGHHHQFIAVFLKEKPAYESVFLGAKDENPDFSYLFVPSLTLTVKQIEWLHAHVEELDSIQQELVFIYLEGNEGIER